MSKKAMVVGASSGVGREIAEILSEKGYDLIILARDKRSLESLQSDLELRFENSIAVLKFDILENKYVEIGEIIHDVNHVFITVGVSLDGDDIGENFGNMEMLLQLNFFSIARLIYSLLGGQHSSLKSISIISSIAAHAPRGKNIMYGASKAALEYFALAVRHAVSSKNINVNVIAIGYTDTVLAYNQKLILPKADPLDVAKYIVSKSRQDCGLIFYPKYWRVIVFILKALPWSVYRRLKF